MKAAIFAGVCALLGTVIGHSLNKRSQRESWLAQKRAEVFAKFLMDLCEYRRDTMKESQEDPTIKGIALEKIFTSANIVCFYLPETTRAEFRGSFERQINFEPVLTGVTTSKDLRNAYEGLFEAEKRMQQIFEKTLKESKPL